MVVSRAGHGTVMKTIMLGKPMILIPIPDHTEFLEPDGNHLIFLKEDE